MKKNIHLSNCVQRKQAIIHAAGQLRGFGYDQCTWTLRSNHTWLNYFNIASCAYVLPILYSYATDVPGTTLVILRIP